MASRSSTAVQAGGAPAGTEIDPVAAGLDEGRLAAIRAHLDGRYVAAGKIVGCQTAIVRGGHVGYFDSIGLADRERGVPMADDTIFRLFSMTKPITGVALMTLYERGHFQLDDPVHRWIPEWRDMEVVETSSDGAETRRPPGRAPTVRDVMAHLSGVGYSFENRDDDPSGLAKVAAMDLEELCAAIGGWPLRSEPGSQWRYSFGTDVCARLVEVMAGIPFDEYVRATILEPLGMVDTDFWVPSDKLHRLAGGYARMMTKDVVLLDDPATSTYATRPTLLSGGAGLVGTTADYLRFVAMLANGGELDGARVIGRKTLELMTANHLPGDADLADVAVDGGFAEVGLVGMGFGLTVAVSKSPSRTGRVGTAGSFMWGGAASTTFWVDPVEQLGVVFMTQLMPSGIYDFQGQLHSLVYAALR